MEKENWYTKFTKGSLVKKTAVSLGIMIAISLTVLLIISASISGMFLTTSISSHFEAIAKQNSVIVQNIVNTASNAASSLQTYIENAYDELGKTGYSGMTEKSFIYEDVVLQQSSKDIEDFILNTAWSTVANNEDICGIGVFFESNKFDLAIKDYTVYISDEDAVNRTAQSYGEYSYYGSQEYYITAANTKTMYFTEPYEDQGVTMVTAAYPIIYNNEAMGVIVVDININKFDKLESTDEDYPSMFASVLNNDGVFIYDSESKDYIGQPLDEILEASQYSKIQKGIDSGKSFSAKTKVDGRAKVVWFYEPIEAGHQTWWAVSSLSQPDLTRNTKILIICMFLASAVLVIFIVAMMFNMLKKGITPIYKVVDASKQLKTGDFEITIQAENDDEIGRLAESFTDSALALRTIIKDLRSVLENMASNNFDIVPNANYQGEFEAIRDSLIEVVKAVSTTLLEINQVSELVEQSAGNISQGAQSITEGATDQASSVEELQATITSVAEVVGQNAQNAQNANKMAQNVGKEITTTNSSMQEVVAAMDIINETSMQISNIINSINDIASQTNLLALNASIEAARAGDAGRGFAVVATQVGELAIQSAEAAKTSTQLIVNTLEAVEKGKTLVDVAAKKLMETAGITNELVNNIDEISQASENQTVALNQVSMAIDQIAAVVEENTAMAEESSASSQELAAQATKLKELIAVFQLYKDKK